MARESLFLSFNKSSDWNRGLHRDMDISDDTLKLKSTDKLQSKTKILSDILKVEDGDKIAVSNFGLINIVKRDGHIHLYDWQCSKSEEIQRSSEHSMIKDTFIYCLNNRIYLINKNNDHLSVTMYSILNRMDIGKYEIKISEKSTLFFIHEYQIFTLDRDMKLTWYDTSTGKFGGSMILKDKVDIDQSNLTQFSVKGFDISFLEKNKEITNYNVQSAKINKIHVSHEYIKQGLFGSNDFEVKWFSNDEKTLLLINNKEHILDIKASYVWMDRSNHIYVMTEKGDIKIYVLEKMHRTDDNNNISTGSYLYPIIDSKAEGNTWHKMAVYADLPDKTHINVKYFAFDIDDLDNSTRLKINSYMDGNLRSYSEVDELLKDFEFTVVENGTDFLFQDAVGRYMILKINMIGTRYETPCIHKARIYINRETYSQYLPEIYQTGEHKDFIERYLSIFESVNMELEEKIDNMIRNFSISDSPKEFLEWIITWMGLSVDDSWSTKRLKLLIESLPSIYRRRGTKESIKKLLEIYLESKIIIIESSKVFSKTAGLNSEMLELLRRHYGGSNYDVTILCDRKERLSDKEKEGVKKILNEELPMYCRYNFIELERWIFLDKHSYLGVNSILSERSSLLLNNNAILPFNSLLIE